MNANDFDIKMLLAMRHSPLRNYIVPGLTSWLIGSPSENGCVRMFQCEREQMEFITPHSHRFDFQCLVLAGNVENRIWSRETYAGDWYTSSTLVCEGPGKYKTVGGTIGRWSSTARIFNTGDCYSMTHREVHSIKFSKDACVLFFEGPLADDSSTILEPHVDGITIPTFKTESWMFNADNHATEEQSCPA
jgi:hypothetical protein